MMRGGFSFFTKRMPTFEKLASVYFERKIIQKRVLVFGAVKDIQ
jgi:hypothetical protein